MNNTIVKNPTNVQYALSIEHITVLHDNKAVLWDISCQIPHGVMMAIVGPNGAGKTTLIHTILNMIKKMSGEIVVCGEHMPKALRYIAYVPQRSLVDWDYPVTVFDVVMMGRFGKKGWFARTNQEDVNVVNSALAAVSMLEYAHRPIGQLSGGQQQRCFLARALVQEASIYILDEPFVGIDAVTEKAIIMLLKSVQSQGKTIIVVHHDLQTLQEYFDWVLLLNTSIVACGPIKEVFTPENVSKAYGYIDMRTYISKK